MSFAAQQYFDPDTNILHFTKTESGTVVTGSSDEMSLGIPDFPTTVNDVKVKVLSIQFMAKMFTDSPATQDLNTDGFNTDSHGSAGTIICGVKNEAMGSGFFNSIDDFEATSGWPVKFSQFACLIGNPASFQYTWKPPKLAFSDEQIAFLNIRSDNGFPSTTTDRNIRYYASIYMRMVRL